MPARREALVRETAISSLGVNTPATCEAHEQRLSQHMASLKSTHVHCCKCSVLTA